MVACTLACGAGVVRLAPMRTELTVSGRSGAAGRDVDSAAGIALEPEGDGRRPSPSVAGEPVRPAPRLPGGTTVLHLGDSFAGALGRSLEDELQARGVDSVLKFESSTYIPDWAWRKPVSRYIRRYRPDLVLITLGANELGIPRPSERARAIRKLVRKLAGIPCVWIAPPLWEGASDRLLSVIRESSPPCAFLNSTELVPGLQRLPDGIHPTTEGRRRWARAVVEWLERRAGVEPEPSWRALVSPAPAARPGSVERSR